MQRDMSLRKRKKQNNLRPVVHSTMIFKVCQALNIEIELIPEGTNTTWDALLNKRSKQNPTLPKVRSKMIFAICNALNIKVALSAMTEEDTGALKPKPKKKHLPVVHSKVVHKICQALGLHTKLNLADDFKSFKLPKKMKTNAFIPVVQSVAIFEFCKALNLKAILANPPQKLK
ncbi:hypothetical protein TNCT_21141 [Trichonephila clavata]|uniref:Uncharacterized protein n=1 Tax=Trichonephila clavata TaxID=2740835 RepID=A0A8X6FYE9_TRICU|nr:hypothetical protein TNCT_21141 [Trichonephila clavata]